MVDEFAHEMAANATQDWTRNHTRQEFVGWLEELVAQTTSRPCSLPRRKLGTLLQDLRSAQQSARTVAPGAVHQLAAHVGRYFLEDRGQPNILNLKFCNSNFEPETSSCSWTFPRLRRAKPTSITRCSW
jgi:hypothetical protein